MRGPIVQVVVLALPPGRRVRRRRRCSRSDRTSSRARSSSASGLFGNGATPWSVAKRASHDDARPGSDGRAPSSVQAFAGASAPSSPAAATISGDGVSPAASAAASGSPPGSAAATASAERGPRRRVLLEAAQDHALDGRIEARRDRSRARSAAPRRACAASSASVAASKALAPGEELVEHEAERVDVAPDRRALARELLGRHVGRRARDLRAAARRRRRDREAEVGDPHAAAAVEHDVGGLQVAVQDAPVVRRGEPGAELPRDLERLVRRQPADAPQQRGEVLAVHVLHREEVLAVDLADVVDAADVGVRDLPRDADLGVEARRAAPGRARASRGRNFSATGWPSFRSSAR